MEKKYFDTKKGSVEEKINTIASEQPTINATYTPDVKLSTEKKYFETKPGSLADAASKIVSEALDPVNKDAVKKKFDDRKDKDIDNDGDTDSTDKYLHKRRAAISKATEAVSPAQQAAIAISKKERGEKPKNEAVTQDDHGEKQNAKKVKDYTDPSKGEKKPFKSLRAETKIIKLGDKGKTATGKDAGAIDVEPSAKPI
jgi:flagellar hook-associated protein FlgK